MLRYLLVGLACVQTACPYNYGSSGELGRSTIDYSCTAQTDPACDCEDYLEFCQGYPSPIEGLLINGVPERIARGAVFRARLHGDDDRYLTTGAPSILAQEADTFSALRPGVVALLVRYGPLIDDFYHLSIVEPARVRIERVDVAGPQAEEVTSLALEPGDTAWLRATYVDGSDQILYGAVDCQWTLAEPGGASLVGSASDNVVGVTTTDATEASTVQVDLGYLSASVQVTSQTGGTP